MLKECKSARLPFPVGPTQPTTQQLLTTIDSTTKKEDQPTWNCVHVQLAQIATNKYVKLMHCDCPNFFMAVRNRVFQLAEVIKGLVSHGRSPRFTTCSQKCNNPVVIASSRDNSKMRHAGVQTLNYYILEAPARHFFSFCFFDICKPGQSHVSNYLFRRSGTCTRGRGYAGRRGIWHLDCFLRRYGD